MSKYYKNNEGRSFERRLGNKFGITVADYSAMHDYQLGCCYVCGGTDKTRRLAVDHNHKTGTVRALLCTPCNTAIGLAKTSDGLSKLADYLDAFDGDK